MANAWKVANVCRVWQQPPNVTVQACAPAARGNHYPGCGSSNRVVPPWWWSTTGITIVIRIPFTSRELGRWKTTVTTVILPSNYLDPLGKAVWIIAWVPESNATANAVKVVVRRGRRGAVSRGCVRCGNSTIRTMGSGPWCSPAGGGSVVVVTWSRMSGKGRPATTFIHRWITVNTAVRSGKGQPTGRRQRGATREPGCARAQQNGAAAANQRCNPPVESEEQ